MYLTYYSKYREIVTFQFIMIFTWVDYKPSYYGDYPYPAWADAMGWMMSMTSVAAIPVVMVYTLCTSDVEGTLWEVGQGRTVAWFAFEQ